MLSPCLCWKSWRCWKKFEPLPPKKGEEERGRGGTWNPAHRLLTSSVCDRDQCVERLWTVIFLPALCFSGKYQQCHVSILTEWIGMGRIGPSNPAKLQLLLHIMVFLSPLLPPGQYRIHLSLFLSLQDSLLPQSTPPPPKKIKKYPPINPKQCFVSLDVRL